MPAEVNVKVPLRADQVRGHHAVVVGVDHDHDPAPGGSSCAADAAGIAAVLRARGYRVRALPDGRASTTRPTRAAVLAAVRATMRSAREDHVVVVYVAGRSRLIDGRATLIMADTPADVGGVLRGGLPLATLLAELQGAPRWVAIFLDVDGLGPGLDPATADVAAHNDERDGGFALLATGRRSAVTEPRFSERLALGLAGAAAAPDGTIAFSALARYVQDGLARASPRPADPRDRARPTPVVRLEIADPPLVPAHLYRDLATMLPAKLGCAAFSPDGRWLVTGCDDHAVRLWDARTGALRHEPMAHGTAVCGVAFSRDGRRVQSASDDGMIQVWDVARGTVLTPAPPPLATSITRVAWSPTADGGLLAPFAEAVLGVADDTIVDMAEAARLTDKVTFRRGIWLRAARGTRLLKRRGHIPLSAAYLRAPGRFVTGGSGGELLLWRARTGTATLVGRHAVALWTLVPSPDGRWVAASGAAHAPTPTGATEVRLWQPTTGASFTLGGHRGSVAALAFSPDGARLASGGHDGIVRLWSVADARCLRELTVAVAGQPHHAEVWSLAFAPDGRRLFAGYGDGRGRIFEL